MNSQEIQETLKILLEKIGKVKVVWYLEGSVNLFVQGVPVEPKDIDITTNRKSFNKFRKILEKETTRDFYIDKTKAHILKCLINSFEIEIALYEEKNKSSFNTIKTLSWKNLNLPTQPLSQALNFYKLISRKDKVELIEKFLSLQTS